MTRAARTPRKKTFWLGLGIGLISGLVVGGFGSTLASNISLGNSPIEFGQGSSNVQACDPSIDLSPSATYSAGAGGTKRWILEFITIKNIDVSKCTGKIFTLSFEAGIPGGGDLAYDTNLRPYRYEFPVDFVPDANDPTTGDYWAGHAGYANNHLFVDGAEVDQAQHGFGAEYVTHNVSSTAADGKIVITVRVLAQTVTTFRLETADQ